MAPTPKQRPPSGSLHTPSTTGSPRYLPLTSTPATTVSPRHRLCRGWLIHKAYRVINELWNIILGCLCLQYTIKSFKLAVWTAGKDFLEHCLDSKSSGVQTPPGCPTSSDVSLGPPPIDRRRSALPPEVISRVVQRHENIWPGFVILVLILVIVVALCCLAAQRRRMTRRLSDAPVDIEAPIHLLDEVPMLRALGYTELPTEPGAVPNLDERHIAACTKSNANVPSVPVTAVVD